MPLYTGEVMTQEELVRGCEKIIELFAESEHSDEIMTDAVRAAISPSEWLNLGEDDKIEYKRELFRAFKAGFNVKLIDDKLTREDLEHLKDAKMHLHRAYILAVGSEELRSEIHNTLAHVEQAMSRE